MFCEHCGSPMDDNSKFCPKCGAPTEEIENTVSVFSDDEKTQASIPETDIPNEEANDDNDVAMPIAGAPVGDFFSGGETVAKTAKRGFHPLKFIKGLQLKTKIIASVLAVAVVGGVAVGPRVINTFKWWLMDGTQYYASVESANIDRMVDTMAKSMPDINDFNVGMNFNAELTKEGKEKIENLADIDLNDYIEGDDYKLDADFSFNSKKSKFMADGALKLNKTEIISGEGIIDLLEKQAFAKIPDFNKKFASFDELEDVDELEDFVMPKISKSQGKKALNLLKKYLKLALKNSGEYEKSKSKETLEAAGISGKYNTVTAEITNGDILGMVEILLEEIQDDKALRKLIKDICKDNKEFLDWLNDSIGSKEDVDADFIIDTLDEALDESLDAIEKQLDERDDEYLETVVIIHKVYVDGEGNIVGRKAIQNEDTEHETVMTFANPTSFGKQGTSITYEQDGKKMFAFEGKANRFFGNLSKGEYTLKAGAPLAKELGLDLDIDTETDVMVSIIDVKVDRFNVKKAQKGLFDGKFSIKLSDDIASELAKLAADELPEGIGDEVSDLIENISLNFDVKNTGKKSNFKMSLSYDKDELLSIGLKAELKKGEKVKSPGKTVNGEDWVEDLDDLEDIIMDNLEKAGVNVDELENLGLSSTDSFNTEMDTVEDYGMDEDVYSDYSDDTVISADDYSDF